MNFMLEYWLYLFYFWPWFLSNAPNSAICQDNRVKEIWSLCVWEETLSGNRNLDALALNVVIFWHLRVYISPGPQDGRGSINIGRSGGSQHFPIQAKNGNYLSDTTWFEFRKINYHMWKHSNHEPGLLFSAQVADKFSLQGLKGLKKGTTNCHLESHLCCQAAGITSFTSK